VVEAWAGLTVLSTEFEKHGATVMGCIELVPELQGLARWKHKQAEVTGDFYEREWERWRDKWGAGGPRIATGGFTCVTLSEAGLKKMDKDSRSTQLIDTLKMATFFGVSAVLLENVYNLVGKDEEHGMLSSAVAFMKDNSFVQVAVWDRVHSRCGGPSQRRRVFPCWLGADIAMIVRPVVREVTDSEPTSVGTCLRHPDKVPDWTKVPGELVRYGGKTRDNQGERLLQRTDHRVDQVWGIAGNRYCTRITSPESEMEPQRPEAGR